MFYKRASINFAIKFSNLAFIKIPPSIEWSVKAEFTQVLLIHNCGKQCKVLCIITKAIAQAHN